MTQNQTITPTNPAMAAVQAVKQFTKNLPTPSASSVESTKALAYLKEYVGQMRAAGFNDISIREKLKKIKSVYIPDRLPANFGQTGLWATGMADEFKQAALKYLKSGGNIKGEQFEFLPSPNEYLNYMPGGTANRLPSYSEYMGQDTSPYYNPSGKFSRAKLDNLRKALQESISGYRGKTISPSQYTMEAGIAGLPTELGQNYYQDFLSLAGQKADEAKKQDEYEELLMQYPEIQFTPGATVEENAAKIRQYNELMQQSEKDFSKIAAELDSVIYQAAANDESISLKDIMKYASDRDIELSYEEALDIFNAAYKRYSEGM